MLFTLLVFLFCLKLEVIFCMEQLQSLSCIYGNIVSLSLSCIYGNIVSLSLSCIYGNIIYLSLSCIYVVILFLLQQIPCADVGVYCSGFKRNWSHTRSS